MGNEYVVHVTVVSAAASAWILLWLGERSPYGRYLTHEAAVGSALPGLALFIAGWTVMLLATLVPTTTPLLAAFRRVARARDHPVRLQLQLVAGFVGVWVLFGYAAFVADGFTHAAIAELPWLAERPHLITGGVLAVAGLSQFSALKERCLTSCRSPQSLLFRHWGRAGGPGRQAVRVGVAHGLSCLGCCWALMLLMFAFAMGSLAWMAALAAVMAVEKHARRGRRLTRPLGVALLGAAVAVITLG